MHFLSCVNRDIHKLIHYNIFSSAAGAYSIIRQKLSVCLIFVLSELPAVNFVNIVTVNRVFNILNGFNLESPNYIINYYCISFVRC